MSHPLLNAFWMIFWFFLWIMWFMLLFRVIADVFSDKGLSGCAITDAEFDQAKQKILA